MQVLLLGGTGAIGTALIEQLKKDKTCQLYVTTRSIRKNTENVQYITGNAHDTDFIKSVLAHQYDAIIDFMHYTSEEFDKRMNLFLYNTAHYFFFSSGRVYAECSGNISEKSERLLDACTDACYLQTHEYALEKARCENLLLKMRDKNWTIIRPYITYNDNRLQLGVFEKEHWLFRAINGRSIVFPKDMAQKQTSLTYAGDVAYAIYKLIGNSQAQGETFHIVTPEKMTWQNVLDIYLNFLGTYLGYVPQVQFIEKASSLEKVWAYPYQIKYDRMFNRNFDSSKISKVIGEFQYKSLRLGLQECLSKFLSRGDNMDPNWKFEAWADRCSGEITPLSSISGIKNRVGYISRRFLT